MPVIQTHVSAQSISVFHVCEAAESTGNPLKESTLIDPSADTYGLRNSLLLPIAATDDGALQTFVGDIEPIGNRDPKMVLLVRPRPSSALEADNPLPARLQGRYRLLTRSPQVWVHPDYSAYRQAYEDAPELRTAGDRFLDHVMNRDLARVLQYRWLRLCPVASEVNTVAGNPKGGEVRLSKNKTGELVRDLGTLEEEMAKPANMRAFRRSRIVYADPFEITKMMNITPGTIPGGLEGVRRAQKWFFAS